MTPGRPSKRGARFRPALGFVLGIAVTVALAAPVSAAPIANPVATFAGLDKITARITNFDVYINETVQFGSLQITPRVCYTRPATETQSTSAFIEIDQVSLKGASDRLFTGWMFAESPALNAVDDPVYDVWLVNCAQHSDVPAPTAVNPPEAGPSTAPVPATSASAAPAPTPAPVAATASSPAPAATPAATTAAATPTPQPLTRTESGSFITLLNPSPTAQTAPDGQ